jgi:beta-mannanase
MPLSSNELDHLLLGLYLPLDIRAIIHKANDYKQLLQCDIKVLSFYSAWGEACQGPDIKGLHEIINNNFIPMITWESWRLPEASNNISPEDQHDFSLTMLLSGRYDDYILQWAKDLRQLPSPIFFRPMHEMNGNWYPWCGTVNGNTPSQYIEAWRYIRSIFQEVCPDNLLWVWSPYVHSVPDIPDNQLGNYFPGTDEVDWLALDGYNWGTSREWATWQSFEKVFENGYYQISQLPCNHPIMIAEVGCSEEGGEKGQWIKEARNVLINKFNRVHCLNWFNVNKECDWRIESSTGSLDAFTAYWAGASEWI